MILPMHLIDISIHPKDPIIILSTTDHHYFVKINNLSHDINLKEISNRVCYKFKLSNEVKLIEQILTHFLSKASIKDTLPDLDFDKYLEMLYDSEENIKKCLEILNIKAKEGYGHKILSHKHFVKILLKLMKTTKNMDILSIIINLFSECSKTNMAISLLYKENYVHGILKDFLPYYELQNTPNNELYKITNDILGFLVIITKNMGFLKLFFSQNNSYLLFDKIFNMISANHMDFFKSFLPLLYNFSIDPHSKIFVENSKLIPKLSVMFDLTEEILTEDQTHNIILSVILNLSFNPVLRSEMIEYGYLNKLYHLYTFSKLQKLSKIIYILSTDTSQIKAMTNSLMITKLLQACTNALENEGKVWKKNSGVFDKLVPAILINYTMRRQNCIDIVSPRNREYLCPILNYALKTESSLWMKYFKNLALHPDICLNFQPYISMIIQYLESPLLQDEGNINSHLNFVIETIALLCHLMDEPNCYQIITTSFLGNPQYMGHVVSLLNNETMNDQLQLNALIFLNGLILNNEEISEKFVKAHGCLNVLSHLMKSKQEDDEFVGQIVYAFYRFLNYQDIRAEIINHESVVPIIIDLMNDKNPLIRQICNVSLGIIADTDPVNWGSVIKEELFIRHNAFWLEMVSSRHH